MERPMVLQEESCRDTLDGGLLAMLIRAMVLREVTKDGRRKFWSHIVQKWSANQTVVLLMQRAIYSLPISDH